MTTMTPDPTTSAPVDLAARRPLARRTPPARIPLTRIIAVEARKSFDTRAGFWMLMSIGITAVLATAGVVLWAPDSALTYDTFAAAIGVPMTVILPMVAILSVTTEWSQRSGLTTFTLVPHRGRTILAKAVVAVSVGVLSIVLAFAIGALGNLLGTAIAGVDPVWNLGLTDLLYIVFANVLGLMIGFMLGVVIRNSPGAIVGYFVYAFVLPTISAILAANQHWYRDLQPWVDFNYTQSTLFDGGLSAQQWTQLGVTGLVWLVIPLAVGLRLVLRSEVK